MRKGFVLTVGLALIGLMLIGAPQSEATVPPATGNNAVITVSVGADRVGTSNVSGLAGATLGLFDTAGAATPVAGFGTCVSDADGDCSFIVPNTQTGGANRDRRFYVKQISAPAGYFANSALATGTGPVASTAYSFQTGTELRNGKTYSSLSNFMFSTGNTNNTASGGVWQNSRVDPVEPPGCGLRVAFVADLSNSVGADLVNLKAAATTFVNALVGTPSSVSLFTFATTAPATGANNRNHPEHLAVSTPAGAAVVNGYINGLTLPGGNDGGTNWDRGFAQVAEATQQYDVTVVMTDGNPTFYGSPTQGPGNRTRFVEVENGIFSSNAIKAKSTRVVAFGVGAGVAGTPDNLRAISGPTANSDYYQTTDYAAAGAALRALALGQCAGSLTVVKQVVPPTAPPGSITGATPQGGWAMAATPASPGLVLSPTSGTTANGSGAINFGITFSGVTNGNVSVSETQQPGYTLQPVGGVNAVCFRIDTGAALTVTNTGPTGFSVGTDINYPVSCAIYNRAPQPAAQLSVSKKWVVNGVTYAEGDQPLGLQAQLTIDNADADWNSAIGGFNVNDTTSINEVTTVTNLPLCTIDSQRLTNNNGSAANAALPYSATLANVDNTYEITNTVTCASRMTLIKNVLNGPATADEWTLSATGPTGSLPGPNGTTPITADVTPDVAYTLAESGGDPRYVQVTDPNAALANGSTGSWDCQQQTSGGGLRSSTPREDGLNGAIVVPLGTWTFCVASNETAEITLAKQVVNSAGATAVPSDWTLNADPSGSVPPGLTPVSVTGSAAGVTEFIRPNQNYDLGETGPAGYQASAWTCNAESTLTGSTVTVLPGAEAACGITNTAIDPRLTLVKEVVNEFGGARTPVEWTLSGSGPTSITGTTGTAAVTDVAVAIGSYTLSETGPDDYTGGPWSCTGGTQSGPVVTVGLGDQVVCTIVNTDTGYEFASEGDSGSGTESGSGSGGSNDLADTGGDIRTPAVVGALALLLGAGLLLAARRRRW